MRRSLSSLALLFMVHGLLFAGGSSSSSDLSVSQTAVPSPNVLVASAVIYTITVRNAGPDPAQSVVVTDTLAPGVGLFSCSSTTGGTCGDAGNDVTVSFNSLAAGGQAIITIIGVVECTVSTGTAITNSIRASSASSDPNSSNNTSSTTAIAFNQPPLIACPDDVSLVIPAGQATTEVAYPEPDFFDKCPGTVVSCSPPTGSTFPVGITVVSCSATDSAGGVSRCAFTIRVTARPPGPQITTASIEGKRLLLRGERFDLGAVILLNDEEQKTLRDDENPTTSLIGKKAGKKVAPGETVVLQVRNASGLLSNEFNFRRPSD